MCFTVSVITCSSRVEHILVDLFSNQFSLILARSCFLLDSKYLDSNNITASSQSNVGLSKHDVCFEHETSVDEIQLLFHKYLHLLLPSEEVKTKQINFISDEKCPHNNWKWVVHVC